MAGLEPQAEMQVAGHKDCSWPTGFRLQELKADTGRVLGPQEASMLFSGASSASLRLSVTLTQQGHHSQGGSRNHASPSVAFCLVLSCRVRGLGIDGRPLLELNAGERVSVICNFPQGVLPTAHSWGIFSS